MTSTITYAGGPILSPSLVLTDSYEAESEPGVNTHTILDGPPVYTLRAAGPDSGTLKLLFPTEAAALNCYRAHKLAAVYTIADTTRALLNFRYVADGGNIGIKLDAGRRRWIVTVPYVVVT